LVEFDTTGLNFPILKSYGFLSRQVLGRCFTQGLRFARGACSTASFKKFRAWVCSICSKLVDKRSGPLVVVLAPGGRGCAKNPAKRFLVVALLVLKKWVSSEAI